MKRRYVQIDGELIEVPLNYIPEPRTPSVIGDIKPYRSMVDGKMVMGRAQHREHLKIHGVVEVGNETKHMRPKFPTPPPGLKQTLIDVVQQKLRYK